jgi:hypothetical protein
MVIVTGAGPQSKVITPPAATAATTAAEVQLAGVPLPITRSGSLVSTARASAGTAAPPPGLPGLGSALGFFDAVGDGDGDADLAGGEEGATVASTAGADTGVAGGGASFSPHPARVKAQVTDSTTAIGERTARD